MQEIDIDMGEEDGHCIMKSKYSGMTKDSLEFFKDVCLLSLFIFYESNKTKTKSNLGKKVYFVHISQSQSK